MPRHLTLVTTLLLFLNLHGQDTIKIPSTNLSGVLPVGFTVRESDGIVDYPDFVTSFMEMPGKAFSTTIGSGDKLRQQYEDGTIVLESFRTDTLGETIYHYLSASEPRRVYQVIFGNENFVAIATMEPTGSTAVDTVLAQQLVHGLTYSPSQRDPLEEHARFSLDTVGFAYELKDRMGTVFFFERKDSGGVLLVMQLPVQLSNEALVENMINQMAAKGIEFKLSEAGETTIGNFTGYRLLAQPSRPEQSEHLKSLSLFATTASGTQLLFQLMGKSSEPDQAAALTAVVERFGWR